MSESSDAAQRAASLELDERVVTRLRAGLADLAERTVAAITVEVPGYSGALTGAMGQNIESAVEMALATFLNLVERSEDADPSTPLAPALDGAYALGRGEARSGRTMDALLAAYRVGARVAWRDMSRTVVTGGVPAETVADFAELMFAYIDALSASSVAGHADELATEGRVRRRYLERLTRQLLDGEPEHVLRDSAERADWPVPETLTAVLVPGRHLHSILPQLGEQTLESGDDVPEGRHAADVAVLLVPDVHGAGRAHLTRVLRGRQAVIGPARRWARAAASYDRASRALELFGQGTDGDQPVDTDQHLAELVLCADPEGLTDLRAQVLAPLETLRPATAEKLRETLRSWLLHHGRRDDVAAELFVHAQTVRYRMGQLRELYGDRLEDPRTVLDLTLALAHPPPASPGADGVPVGRSAAPVTTPVGEPR